ncbi:MAG: DMT family transporter [Bacteroidales bacterium]|nr:DMT family transporter [Bacteroidales bacterium]MBN2749620.1 DMT family transporter [Bacteroidales bacterium]
MNSTNRSYLYAGLTILFWATSATAFKIALRHVDHVQLLFLASLTSTVALFVVLLLQGKLKELRITTRNELKWSLFLGFLNPFAYYFVLFIAYGLLPAQVAQPLNFIWPIAMVILSVPILGQHLSLRSFFALILSFIGVVLISSQGSFSVFAKSNPLGVALAVGSSIIWALFWLYNVRDSNRDEVVKLFWNFLVATLLCLGVGLFRPSFFNINLNGAIASVYIGLFEMGFTFVLWLKALSHTKSTAKLGNIVFFVPFLSLVIIWAVLKEHIYWTTLAGLAVIIGSVIYQRAGKAEPNS